MATANNFEVYSKSEYQAEYNGLLQMVSDQQVDCWRFFIRGIDFCGALNPSIDTIFFFNFGQFKSPKRKIDLETKENGFGQKTILRKAIKWENSFDFLCDDRSIRQILEIECYNTMEGSFGSSTFEIEDFVLEQKQTIGDLRLCTISFSAKEDVLGNNTCCYPAYGDAPFIDNCPPANVYVVATDDAEAATFGVQVGEPYRLDIDTPYGFPNHLRIREN